MKLTILGENPFSESGVKPACRIGTLFVRTATLVTLPGVHATQRIQYLEIFKKEYREQKGIDPSRQQVEAVWNSAVDLIFDGQTVQIRPDAKNMPLAFAGDELLQELVPKQHIRFLYARLPEVQQAIRERGEYWRISPRPQSPAEIARAIENSRIGIAGRPIYYYNAVDGVRFLTVAAFAGLVSLSAEELRAHLLEIQIHSARRNRRAFREIGFFEADPKLFNSGVFAEYDFEKADESRLRAWHREILERFREAVPACFHRDDIDNLAWRNPMFRALMGNRDDTVIEKLNPRLTPEFFRQIQWLPGGRIEDGELMFDSIFGAWEENPDDPELRELCDEKVKGFICNYIREFGTLQYINIGRLTPAIRRRARGDGHCAYIAEVQHRDSERPVMRILRVQRWGIREHLDRGRDLLWAILEAEEYTEYTLDRRLGCWELGMPLPVRIDTRRVREIYHGPNLHYAGNVRIWTTYYERKFIEGIATDKVPPERFRDENFALAFARLLGRAAAPNLVVGRTTLEGEIAFDSGDEMLILDAQGQPARIVVADHAGTFNEYEQPLVAFAREYARPICKRRALVSNSEAFIDAYITAFADALRAVQNEYRRKRRAFETLFQHSKQGKGAFSWRWAKVLERLDQTDVDALAESMQQKCTEAAEYMDEREKLTV